MWTLLLLAVEYASTVEGFQLAVQHKDFVHDKVIGLALVKSSWAGPMPK